MISSYFVEVHTGTHYGPGEYDAAAGRLSNMLVSVLSDPAAIGTLTQDALRTNCHSEIEVGLEEDELVAKTVIDLVGPGPIALAKAKFTQMLKARPEADEWKHMKVTKRMVPQVPETFGT